MSTGSKRRHFSAQEKVTILKRHIVEKVPVADLCDELQINRNAMSVKPPCRSVGNVRL